MAWRQYLLLLALVVVAGLVGGAVSNYVLLGKTAVAKTAQNNEKLVTAEEFRLVDKTGKKLGVLAVGPGGPVLRLFDEHGNVRVGIGVFANTPVLSLFGEIRSKVSIGKIEGEMPQSSVFITVDRIIDTPHLVLKKDDKVIWSVPY